MINQEAVDYIREAVMYYSDSGLAQTRTPSHIFELVEMLQGIADKEDYAHELLDELEQGDWE